MFFNLLTPLILLSASFSYCTVAPIEHLDAKNFTEDLSGFNLVEFYTPKCHYCKKLSKQLVQVDRYFRHHPEEVNDCKFSQINCEKKACKKLQIKTIPLLRIYYNDKQIGEIEGYMNARKIVDWVKKKIASNKLSIGERLDDKSSLQPISENQIDGEFENCDKNQAVFYGDDLVDLRAQKE